MNDLRRPLMIAIIISGCVVNGSLTHAHDQETQPSVYVQTNLAADLGGTKTTDPNLKNAWGLAFFPGSPFWVVDNGAGVSTLYDGVGLKNALTVTIPPPSSAAPGTTSAPTGIVWNGGQGFNVPGTTLPAIFIFDTEDGTIAAWNPGADQNHAILAVDNSGTAAVYKGLALGTNVHGNFIYATNFNAGTVDVFDVNFQQAILDGQFSDPNLPAGFAPFGIRNIDGDLFVTYALQNSEKHDDVAGVGNGFVDVFDTDGHLLLRFASQGTLNSPWGLTRASFSFGQFSSDILVGNFGDGLINVFNSKGKFLGGLFGPDGQPIQIDGLWSLSFGGGKASSPDDLYFTAGPNQEQDGLFGTITVMQNGNAVSADAISAMSDFSAMRNTSMMKQH